jgi:hypothetical protein
VYTSGPGIRFDNAALDGDAVVGNLVFASDPISGPISRLADNITGKMERAPDYVRMPSFDASKADFYPLSGMCQGGPIDMTMFQANLDSGLDFNGVPKNEAKGAVLFRGAYAGDGRNPGWILDAGLKPAYAPAQ